MTIKFENPPINELIIATYFNQLMTNMSSEHIGLFWSRIRREFPKIQQQLPVGGDPLFDVHGNDVFPMPRYWFMSDDHANLIQLQKNAFMFNWRRKDSDYPHFDENLKVRFDEYFN